MAVGQMGWSLFPVIKWHVRYFFAKGDIHHSLRATPQDIGFVP